MIKTIGSVINYNTFWPDETLDLLTVPTIIPQAFLQKVDICSIDVIKRCHDTPAIHDVKTETHDFYQQISHQYSKSLVPEITSTHGFFGFKCFVDLQIVIVRPTDVCALYNGGLSVLNPSFPRLINFAGRLYQAYYASSTIIPGLWSLHPSVNKILAEHNGYDVGEIDQCKIMNEAKDTEICLMHTNAKVASSESGLRTFLRPKSKTSWENQAMFLRDYKVEELRTSGSSSLAWQVSENLLSTIMNMLDAHRKAIGKAICDKYKDNMIASADVSISACVISFDIVFQQLDMILTLLVRKIPITTTIKCKDFISTQQLLTLPSLHQLFIDNMVSPYTYIRRPMSLYMDSIHLMQTWWQACLEHPEQLYNYQKDYQYYSSAGPVVLEDCKEKKDDYKVSINISSDLILHGKFISDRVPPVTHFKQPLRTKPCYDLSKWNLTRKVSEYSSGLVRVLQTAAPDLLVEGVKMHSEWEAPLQVLQVEHKYMCINGVSFLAKDLRLFYNTFLLESISRDEEICHTFKLLPYKDLLLLRETLMGRCPLLYLYENISKYGYSILCDERSMLQLYDLYLARILINREFRIGLPLRQQLAQMKIPNKYGEISRLQELVALAKE